MKKTKRLSTVLAVVASIALMSFVVAGCSSNDSASSKSSAADLESAFPQHAASAEAGEGEAGFHMQLGEDCESCHTGDLNAEVAALSASETGEEPALSSSYYMDNQ